jgi:rRNA maturation protein Nop10
MTPSRNGTVTERCAACGGLLPAGRPRRTCSDACRQALWRRRHQKPLLEPDLPTGQPRRPYTVYQCDSCGARTLGEQRCDDCGTFMRRAGLGGLCPCCDEPITVEEILGI